MKKQELILIRTFLGKTQKEFSHMLGTSLKAIQSFEQGWRQIPPYIERQALLLITLKKQHSTRKSPCWEKMKCSQEARQQCAAYELHAGHLCWFITGTKCGGVLQPSWKAKIEFCRQCDMFQYLFSDSLSRDQIP